MRFIIDGVWFDQLFTEIFAQILMVTNQTDDVSKGYPVTFT